MKKFSILLLCLASLVFGVIVAGLFDTDSRGIAIPKDTNAPIQLQSNDVCCPNFAEINKKVSPAVVAIYSSKVVKYSHPFFDDELFRYFFGIKPEQEKGQEEKVQSGGSGFIISPDGYILTNEHVVEDADEVEVVIGKDENLKAKVIGKDAPTDLALLKIDYKEPLPTIPLGDSDKLEIGEWVMAVGFPLAYGKTVTVGVISAKERKIGISQTTSSFENFLQTDAAINFGNSGGPLINIKGEAIGVNTAISLRGQNIGFAVPINQFKEIEEQLKSKGKVTRGYLGVRIKEVTEEIQKAFKLKSLNGAFVDSVEKNSPAQEAGLKHGDVIFKVDSKEIEKPQDLINYISSKKPGTKVKVFVIRDGKEKSFGVILTTRKEKEEEELAEINEDEEKDISKLGISVTELTQRHRNYYNIPLDVDGVLVTGVKKISKAYEKGLREGDVIMEANGVVIKSPNDLKKVYSSISKGDYLKLYVYKSGRVSLSMFIIIPVE